MVKSFFHSGFVVRDLEKSIRFYTEVMGLRVVVNTERTGEYAERLLGFPGAHVKVAILDLGDGHALDLVQYISPSSREPHVERNDLGAAHLAFLVDNIEGFYEETSKKGLKYVNPPVPLYQGGRMVRKGCYAQDPDGNWLEFVELL